MPKPNHQCLDVWVIEDNEEMRVTLMEVIDSDAEMMCTLSFPRCEEALTALQKESPPQVMLMDIGLPGMSGIEGVRRIRVISPATQILMLTIYEDAGKRDSQFTGFRQIPKADCRKNFPQPAHHCHAHEKHLRQAARTLPQRGGGEGAERTSPLADSRLGWK